MNQLAFHRVALASCLLVAPAAAQYGLSTTALGPVNAPRSVVLAQTPIGLHAICSLTNASTQIPVNVTTPTAPVVGTSATFSQDQYCDAVWTRAFGGRLITAHRFGNVRTWDATPASLLGPLPGVSLTTTNYSHEGLETFSDMTGNTYVLYGEQHTSPTIAGGLILYQLTATGLTWLGQHLTVGCAGSSLELSNDGRFVWQWGDRNNNNLDGVLRVYSTNGYTGAPLLLNTVAYPYTYGYPDKDLKKNAAATNLVGAMGWDGLVAVDTSVPVSPVINTLLGPSTVIYVDGVTFAPGTNLALVWGLVRVASVDTYFMMFFDATVPGMLIPLVGLTPGFKVDDIKIFGNHFYVLGRDPITNAPLLVIY